MVDKLAREIHVPDRDVLPVHELLEVVANELLHLFHGHAGLGHGSPRPMSLGWYRHKDAFAAWEIQRSRRAWSCELRARLWLEEAKANITKRTNGTTNLLPLRGSSCSWWSDRPTP